MKSLRNRLFVGTAAIILAVTGFNVSGIFDAPPPDLKLVLNVPASRLDVYEHGELTRSYEVSAGAPKFATPMGNYRIRQVTWNPWWHPPKSEWARNDKPTPPGPDNPMGPVKINFADLLYIHGTVWEDHLGAPASHGCIRIGRDDLYALAELIHKYRTPRVDAQQIAMLKNNREMTRTFYVKPVAFDVVYNVVEMFDGKLVIHPDVYRNKGEDLREEIVSVLKKAGIEISDAIQNRLASLSKRRLVTRLTVNIDSLKSAGAAGD
ncbi:MAG TPA: L,D-transpeptidase [Longimicrobiales bacterium]|nr:L,D-transpeptidase [Longimicrobiales bacterium]